MSNRNLYEFADIVATFGSKSDVAEALNVHRSQITRWCGEVPPAKQIEIMRIFDDRKDLKKRHKQVRNERRERERENGQLPD